MAKYGHNGKLTTAQFRSEQFHCNCDIWRDGSFPKGTQGKLWYDEFIYFLQKAFVEAHAVMPSVKLLKRRIRFLGWALRLCKRQSWYKTAHANLFDDKGNLREDAEQHRKYVSLEKASEDKMFTRLANGKKHYIEFVEEATELAATYIEAAHQLFDAPRLDDDLRGAFREVVVNADLGFPLELHILQKATDNLPKLKQRIADIRSRWNVASRNAACSS